MKQLFSWLVREPLVHFVVLGVLIFTLFGSLVEPRPDLEPHRTILIEPAIVEQLAARFQAVWLRPPKPHEMRALIEDFVREEIYYREALRLGLDRNDAMVRRRLRQKMEFLTDSGADLIEPTSSDLEAHLLANPEIFGQPARIAFEQVYLGETVDPQTVTQALRALRSDTLADAAEWRRNTMLPQSLRLSTCEAIDAVFGQGFCESIAALPQQQWAGPVESSYGLHLIRIIEAQAAQTQPLERVHDAVLRDWKATKAIEIRDQYYAQLRDGYKVVLPNDSTTVATEKP